MAGTILIVDDSTMIAGTLAARLRAHGYEVLLAVDGQQGLEKAQREQPDLILLDLMLPKLNGHEVCAMLKQDARYQKIPIVMLTASLNAKDEQLAKECGADTFLRKPVQPEQLLETVRRLVA